MNKFPEYIQLPLANVYIDTDNYETTIDYANATSAIIEQNVILIAVGIANTSTTQNYIEEHTRYSVLAHIGKYTDDWANISPDDVMDITDNVMNKSKIYYSKINMAVAYNHLKFTELKKTTFIINAIENKQLYLILYDKNKNMVRVWGDSHDNVATIIQNI